MKWSHSSLVLSVVLAGISCARSLDGSSVCPDGVIQDYFVLGTEILATKVYCPSNLSNTVAPNVDSTELRRISPRQGCSAGCGLTCTATQSGPTERDCEQLFSNILIAVDDGSPDQFTLDGETSMVFQFNTCSFIVYNLQNTTETFCQTQIASIGDQVSADCIGSTAGVCTSSGGPSWKVVVTRSG